MTKVFITKIKPVIDKSGVDKMERDLNKRFKRVSEGFKKGMKKSFRAIGKFAKSGAFAGAILGVINKVASPIEKVNQIIDKSLSRADQIGTLATQFGVSAELMQKTLGVLSVKGIGEESSLQILNKFQETLGRQQDLPEDRRIIRGLSGDETSLEAFWKTIGGLQQASDRAAVQNIAGQQQSPDRAAVQNIAGQIFGGGEVVKMAELLDTKDLESIAEKLDIVSGELINRGGTLEERQALLNVNRENRLLAESLKRTTADVIRLQSEVKTKQEVANINRITEENYRNWALASEAATTFKEATLDIVDTLVGKGVSFSKRVRNFDTTVTDKDLKDILGQNFKKRI